MCLAIFTVLCIKGQNPSWPCTDEIQPPFYWVNKTLNISHAPRKLAILFKLDSLHLFWWPCLVISYNSTLFIIVNKYLCVISEEWMVPHREEKQGQRFLAPWFLFIFLLCHAVRNTWQGGRQYPLTVHNIDSCNSSFERAPASLGMCGAHTRTAMRAAHSVFWLHLQWQFKAL